ncbi:hypothetical protein Tco_0516058 [Tanacetum coccineum]
MEISYPYNSAMPSAKTTTWNEFSSTMAFAIICLATNQKFNFSKYIFDNMVKNLEGGVKFLMYPRFVQVFLDKQVEGMTKHKEIYVTPSHTKNVFANMKREGKGFSGRVTPLFETMMVQAPKELKPITNKAANEEHVPIHSIDPLLSGLKRLRKVGRTARIESSKDEDLGAQEDASKQGRKIANLDADVDVTLVDEAQEGNDDNLIAIPTTVDELTLAQTLIEIKATKPKVVTTAATQQHNMLFENTMKCVDSFVPMDSEDVKGSKSQAEGSSKRTGEEFESDNSKKQKIDENVEAEVDDEAEIKKHIEIVVDEEEIAVDAIPLATKPPIIVDWKIIKEGKMGYF